MNNMEYCPVCDASIKIEKITEIVELTIRGEIVKVEGHFEKCPECEERWEAPTEDLMDRAFRKYRMNHDLLFPDEIKAIRKKYSLTQAELCKILGFGLVTLSRYENGALQDHTHDNTLRMANKPEIMIEMIKRSEGALTKERKRTLIEKLKSEININSILESIMSCFPVTEMSGQIGYNMKKFKQMVLFFSQVGDIAKTKMNKLLFYADFRHYKTFGKSITGMQYAAITHGPVPDNYQTIFESMCKKDEIAIVQGWAGAYPTGTFESISDFEDSLFTEDEMKTMRYVQEYFQDYSAKMIVDFSHREKGFNETTCGSIIPYTYAKDLLI